MNKFYSDNSWKYSSVFIIWAYTKYLKILWSDENIIMYVPLGNETVLVCETYRQTYRLDIYWTQYHGLFTTTTCTSANTGYQCTSYLYFIPTEATNNTIVQCYLRNSKMRWLFKVKIRRLIVRGTRFHCYLVFSCYVSIPVLCSLVYVKWNVD